MPAIAIQFVPVKDLTGFDAEVAVTEGDFVYHFFPSEEVKRMPGGQKHWIEEFPKVLEATSKEYFKADFPRLKAAYTEEQTSWWMRAYGFGMVLDPLKMALGYCDVLDEALDRVKAK